MEIINDTEFKTILGYNPFLNKKKGAGKLADDIKASYVYYLDMFALLSQIAYRWKKIPLEIPQYQIEKCLFYTGIAGITYDDEIKKYIVLPCVKDSGTLDIYGEPTKFRMYSYSKAYYKSFFNRQDGFVCYNNSLKKSGLYLAYRYSKRLQMIDYIIDLNIKQQRNPYILVCDEKTKLTLQNFINKVDLGENCIYGTKELDIENAIKVLDLKVDLKAKDLIDAKREIFNEACLYLGITSNISNKRERLIASEVNTEEKRYDIYREIGLMPRKYFCELVNQKFKLDIDVEYVLDERERQRIEQQMLLQKKVAGENIDDELKNKDDKKNKKVKK